MRYPEALKKGDKIGITAPSMGVTGVFSKRLDNAIYQLKGLGFECIETPLVRNIYKETRTSPKQRAEEFMSLYFDKEIKAIIPPWGGEFLMDMLPYLDYERIKNTSPKWILGFSDISTLLFTLTLKCDIATAHGPNLLDFGCNPIDESVLNVLDILHSNDEFQQTSLELYQKEWGDVRINNAIPYQLTEKVEWRLLGDKDKCEFEGRLIGGCLDTICKLIGTPFAPVQDFLKKYNKDGFIWFIESCDMNAGEIYRTLWQMKMNGWFENCQGVLYGRPEGYTYALDFDLVDSLTYALEELNIPVLYNVDLGHIPPQLTFINGAFALIDYENFQGKVIQKLI